jgi:hypothetical protein
MEDGTWNKAMPLIFLFVCMILLNKEVLEERQLVMLIVNIDRVDDSCQHLMYIFVVASPSLCYSLHGIYGTVHGNT